MGCGPHIDRADRTAHPLHHRHGIARVGENARGKARRVSRRVNGYFCGAAPPVAGVVTTGAGLALRVPCRSTWLAVAHSPMMVALPLKRLFTSASRLLRMPMPVLIISSRASVAPLAV